MMPGAERTGECMVGMFAVSLAGHDKGQMYLIIKEENDLVYLVDGRLKCMNNPKKKNKKHLQIVKTDTDTALTEKINNQQTVYNEEIRRALKARTNRR